MVRNRCWHHQCTSLGCIICSIFRHACNSHPRAGTGRMKVVKSAPSLRLPNRRCCCPSSLRHCHPSSLRCHPRHHHCPSHCRPRPSYRCLHLGCRRRRRPTLAPHRSTSRRCCCCLADRGCPAGHPAGHLAGHPVGHPAGRPAVHPAARRLAAHLSATPAAQARRPGAAAVRTVRCKLGPVCQALC